MLLGPKYALLREEFFEVKKRLKKRDGKVQRLLVFYGGSDATNETEKAIRAILRLNACVDTDIVVGARNPHKESIRALCNSYEFLHYYEQVDNMAELMNNADLMLGAGGATTWERCFLELPCIVTAIAENQRKSSEDCAFAGLIEYLGFYDTVDEKAIIDSIHSMDSEKLVRMAENCLRIFNEGNE
jgi:spore coat polysaccharide biosynthesis predicted glycosyltransferase SpsG